MEWLIKYRAHSGRLPQPRSYSVKKRTLTYASKFGTTCLTSPPGSLSLENIRPPRGCRFQFLTMYITCSPNRIAKKATITHQT
eukprot:scaffold492_cov341-Pavlova_lutheri.AAC.19